ncbi:MAG: cytochrome b/b6 domain-containing protein [Magnetococcales bacterium]|nr:cytochrome b/b6 domain-containing protein [Magnetococcales bacterium]
MPVIHKVLIWDPLLRLFHGLLVLGVGALFLLEEKWLTLHVIIGYGVLGLLLFRLIWGWMGPTHARFRDFVRPPTQTLDYLKAVVAGTAPRFVGHNPAGGMMVILLLATLLATTLSGILTHAADQGGGLAAGMVALFAAGENDWFESGHEFFAGLLLVLVLLHLGGVAFTSFHQRENLVKAMITGYKPCQEERP